MSKHIYHYCAMRQIEGGVFDYYDGIAILESKLKNYLEYKMLKMKIDKSHHNDITITSLSYLGEE